MRVDQSVRPVSEGGKIRIEPAVLRPSPEVVEFAATLFRSTRTYYANSTSVEVYNRPVPGVAERCGPVTGQTGGATGVWDADALEAAVTEPSGRYGETELFPALTPKPQPSWN